MTKRGLTLLGVLGLMLFMMACFLASQTMIDQSRQRIRHARQQQQARALAFSGLEYARAGWSGQRYRSPSLGGGWFELERRDGQVRATGHSGRASYTEVGP